MGIDLRALSLILAASLLLGAGGSAAAQASPAPQSAPPQGAEAGAEEAEAKTFFFKLDAEGNPVFTQVIGWEGDPNAKEYEFIARDQAGATILDLRTRLPSQEVHFAPGLYSYKIITYNLLGKAEIQTEWIDMAVIKAEQPGISEVSPSTLYMDSLDGRLQVTGSKLLPEGVVTMIASSGKKYVGKVEGRKGDEEIAVVFPDEAYESGSKALRFENPGGLFATREDAVLIKFQRPVDLLASLSYQPFIGLYDDWFLENWSDGFNPIAAGAQVDLFFLKQRWGFVGAELGCQWKRLLGGEDKAAITSDFVLASLELVYKYRFTRRLHGVARVGGGYAWSYHSFDYEGFQGPTTDSWDPCAQAGMALQLFLPSKVYFELGADWSTVLFIDGPVGGISPRLSFGYQLY